MRLPYVGAIYRKEVLDLIRDRRTMISMVIVPVLVIPLLMLVVTRLVSSMEQKAEREAKTLSIGLKISNPEIRTALQKAELQVADRDDLQAGVEKKDIVAAVEE